MEDQPLDLLNVKILLKVKGNIRETTGRKEITYDVPKAINIFCIEGDEVVIDEYDKFDLYLQIEMLEVKCFRIKIEQQLNWNLDECSINNLNKNHGSIRQPLSNWSGAEIAVHALDKRKKQFVMQKLKLPKNILSVTVDHKIVIFGDGDINKSVTYGSKGSDIIQLAKSSGSPENPKNLTKIKTPHIIENIIATNLAVSISAAFRATILTLL